MILLVEDDAQTRQFVSSLLKYITNALVIEAESPDAAIAQARRMARPLDVLISGSNLQACKSGIELAYEMSESNPALQVILMSAADAPAREVPREWRYLSKPFAISLFAQYVYDALGLREAASYDSPLVSYWTVQRSCRLWARVPSEPTP